MVIKKIIKKIVKKIIKKIVKKIINDLNILNMMIKKVVPVVKQSLHRILDEIIPPTCISCKTVVESHDSLCHACWERLQFISDPFCQVCGKPFEFEVDDLMCHKCILEKKHLITATRAVLLYNDMSSRIIMSFKHGDDLHGVNIFARWMSLHGKEMIDNSQVITSVPLHMRRLLYRKYNQSSLLANALGKLNDNIEVNNHLLLRKHNTDPQGRKKPKEREQNVKGAFVANPAEIHNIKNKNILIVDDVYTTGATLKHCAKVLLSAGARKIFALVLARVK